MADEQNPRTGQAESRFQRRTGKLGIARWSTVLYAVDASEGFYQIAGC